jgi:hypothetical protein
MKPLRSTLFGYQTKNRAALFLLPNAEQSYSILKILNEVIPFSDIPKSNAT